jgi:hypothetical protein
MAARNCLTLRGAMLLVLMLTAVEAITTLKQAVRKKLLIMVEQKKTTLKLSLQHLQAVLNCTKSNWQTYGKPVVKQHSEQ